MVNFTVFNELSLPLNHRSSFNDFFELLRSLNDKGFKTIRMDRDFKEYSEILPNRSLQEFFGTLDKDEKTKLRTFINNGISIIESPLIKDEEVDDNEEFIENEYIYDRKSTFGGLACADIWDTIAVSFNSNHKWDKDTIVLQRNALDIEVKHASNKEHLESFKGFFEAYEEFHQLGITRENLWNRRIELFPKKIVFSKEVEKQIQDLDKVILEQAIGILRDVESNKKNITDYNYSGESKSVKDDDNLKKHRYFTIDNKKIFFENHIKSLPNGNRIYFLEQDSKIYIGYIGKHLPTKKFK